ncbi:MAG: hypothetical protein U0R23_03065 [Candidatus Nanopelagicales bacterium]
MGKSFAIALLVAAVTAVIVWVLGRLLDSEVLTQPTVAIGAGLGAGCGYLLTPGAQARWGSRRNRTGD